MISERQNPSGPIAPCEAAPARDLDEAKLAAARVFATSRYPYLATPLFAMATAAAPEAQTIAVDRAWRLHADPIVVEEMEAAELGRLLVHLVSHLLRSHADRAERAGIVAAAVAWNRAGDAEINDDLVAAGLVPSCAPDLPGTFGQPNGLAAEQYYEALGARASHLAGARHWDCGSGSDAVPRPWDGGPTTATCPGLDPRSAEWVRLATAAELQRCEQKEPGSVPAGWMRWAEQLLPSKTDWRRLLAAEIRGGLARVLGMVDYRYSKPSRRAAACPEVVLPVLEQPIPEVAIVCDTSGSMGEDELGRCLAEVESMIQRTGLSQHAVPVLACDAAVHAVRRVRRASEVALVGGGGTDMGAGIDQALRLRPRPSVVVVLTDGYTPWPAQPPKGARVVAGIVRGRRPGPGRHPPAPPDWIRSVLIED